MFDPFYKLYRSHTQNTPLEDFTTEAFKAVLDFDNELLMTFCHKFLKMQSNTFTVKTQQYFTIENEPNCFVDMVISGENDICFIENKVDSVEGYKQLNRYGQVLNNLKSKNFETQLVYCTKYDDPKICNNHKLKQFKWNDIALFLNKHGKSKIAISFFNFLKQHNMTSHFELNSKHLIALENLKESLDLMDAILEEANRRAIKYFGEFSDFRNGKSFKEELRNHDRYCMAICYIIDHKGYSEILFSIKMDGNLNIQIYVERQNPDYEKFNNAARKDQRFEYHTMDTGSWIEKKAHLGQFLGKENAPELIADWFEERFKEFRNFIENTKDVNWILELPEL